MANLKELYTFMDECFPFRLQEKGDNSGLIAGDYSQKLKKVLLTLDITFEAIKEAIEGGFNAIISHHPIVFEPLKSISSSDYVGKKLFLLIKNDIGAFSVHTNFDIAEGGVNDCLANCLGLKKIKPFLKTSSELSAFGQEKQNYLGRIGICEKTSVKEFALFVKERLNCNGVRFSECGRPVEKVAVIGGSGGSFYIDALKAGADTLVTGDCKYSSFLPAKELGLNIIDAGHFATENAVLLPLKDMLSKNFNEIHFEIAKTNIDCVEYLQ